MLKKSNKKEIKKVWGKFISKWGEREKM